jgi:hypothetical protein
MSNRMRSCSIGFPPFDPAVAEGLVWIYPERLTWKTEVRGRLTGPRCYYSSTVEVAYPLREQSRDFGLRTDPSPNIHIHARVIIPEPSFWDPVSPFLYDGVIELWEDDQLCQQLRVQRGLRTISLGHQGLRCNGALLALRGIILAAATEEELLRLRQAGYNLLLAPFSATGLLELADKLGFLVLSRITNPDDWRHLEDRVSHPSCLGHTFDVRLLENSGESSYPILGSWTLQGIELSRRPAAPLPKGTQFVLCPEELLSDLAQVKLPKLVLTSTRLDNAKRSDQTATLPGILGWIYTGELTP